MPIPQQRHKPATDTQTPLPKYERRVGGDLPPQYVLDMMTSPGALRARAAIRIDLAHQDVMEGDTWAEQTNRHIAADLLERARRQEKQS